MIVAKQLTEEQKQNLYDLAVILYQEKGQEATEQLGELFDLPSKYCEACEAFEPNLDDSCFVCGSSTD